MGLSNVGSKVLTVVTMKSTMLWDMMPCSPVEIPQCFRGIYCLQRHNTCQLLACPSTLKTEVAYSLETLVNFYWTGMASHPENKAQLQVLYAGIITRN
jgi:hypothetical protein